MTQVNRGSMPDFEALKAAHDTGKLATDIKVKIGRLGSIKVQVEAGGKYVSIDKLIKHCIAHEGEKPQVSKTLKDIKTKLVQGSTKAKWHDRMKRAGARIAGGEAGYGESRWVPEPKAAAIPPKPAPTAAKSKQPAEATGKRERIKLWMNEEKGDTSYYPPANAAEAKQTSSTSAAAKPKDKPAEATGKRERIKQWMNEEKGDTSYYPPAATTTPAPAKAAAPPSDWVSPSDKRPVLEREESTYTPIPHPDSDPALPEEPAKDLAMNTLILDSDEFDANEYDTSKEAFSEYNAIINKLPPEKQLPELEKLKKALDDKQQTGAEFTDVYKKVTDKIEELKNPAPAPSSTAKPAPATVSQPADSYVSRPLDTLYDVQIAREEINSSLFLHPEDQSRRLRELEAKEAELKSKAPSFNPNIVDIPPLDVP